MRVLRQTVRRNPLARSPARPAEPRRKNRAMERGPRGKPAGHLGEVPAGVLELPYGRDVSARASRAGRGPKLESAARAALPLRWRALRTQLSIIVLHVCLR